MNLLCGDEDTNEQPLEALDGVAAPPRQSVDPLKAVATRVVSQRLLKSLTRRTELLGEKSRLGKLSSFNGNALAFREEGALMLPSTR